ncbi:MAG: hypothetical protein GC159_20730 [Phycisphaera sp.]|nr:hypothetical protein [Phycisphaera sp.]
MTLTPPPFQPPSAEQVRVHLRACEPRPSININTVMMFVSLGALLIIWETVEPGWVSLSVTWMVIAGYLAWRAYATSQARSIQAGVVNVYELTLLRRSREALLGAWDLLPRLYRQPAEHAQVVSIMTNCLMRLRAYDPAVETCEYLLAHVPPQHPAGYLIRLQRLLGHLHLDRLADADDEIRSLRNASLGPYEAAVLTTAHLYQQIKTNHHDDAADLADEAIDRLHPLGIEAGYGYGLIATAFHFRGDADAAGRWWRRATMLIPGHAIAYDLPETVAMLGAPEGVHPPFARPSCPPPPRPPRRCDHG